MSYVPIHQPKQLASAKAHAPFATARRGVAATFGRKAMAVEAIANTETAASKRASSANV